MVEDNLMSIYSNFHSSDILSQLYFYLCGIHSFLALHKIRQGEAAPPYQGQFGTCAAFLPNTLDVRSQILNEDNVVVNCNPGPKVPPPMQFGQESKRHANHISCLSQMSTEPVVDLPEYVPECKCASPIKRQILSFSFDLRIRYACG